MSLLGFSLAALKALMLSSAASSFSCTCQENSSLEDVVAEVPPDSAQACDAVLSSLQLFLHSTRENHPLRMWLLHSCLAALKRVMLSPAASSFSCTHQEISSLEDVFARLQPGYTQGLDAVLSSLQLFLHMPGKVIP